MDDDNKNIPVGNNGQGSELSMDTNEVQEWALDTSSIGKIADRLGDLSTKPLRGAKRCKEIRSRWEEETKKAKEKELLLPPLLECLETKAD